MGRYQWRLAVCGRQVFSETIAGGFGNPSAFIASD
jgi:hypothetical protein